MPRLAISPALLRCEDNELSKIKTKKQWQKAYELVTDMMTFYPDNGLSIDEYIKSTILWDALMRFAVTKGWTKNRIVRKSIAINNMVAAACKTARKGKKKTSTSNAPTTKPLSEKKKKTKKATSTKVTAKAKEIKKAKIKTQMTACMKACRSLKN